MYEYNQDGPGLTWPTTFLILGLMVAIVITVVATYKKLRWCHQKRKIKEAEDLHKVVNVKNNRPLHVSYDIDRFEEVITERQVSALPVIDRLPTQAEPKAAVVFLRTLG